ncbi:MAG: phosphorylase [Acidiferrobacterales bacterium]
MSARAWLIVCGMGPVELGFGIGDVGATTLLSWGTAGALDSALVPGRLALPQTVTTAQGDIFKVDVGWHARVSQRLAEWAPTEHALIESEFVVTEPATKAALFNETGAVVVDMESAAVARVAKTRGLPFLVIRAISDSAGRRLPSALMDALDHYGQVRRGRLARAILREPRLIPDLVRLWRESRAAHTALIRTANLLGPDFLA